MHLRKLQDFLAVVNDVDTYFNFYRRVAEPDSPVRL